MKKIFTVMIVAVVMMGVGILSASAQEWVWSNPSTVSGTTQPLAKLETNPVTGDLYFIDTAGNFVSPVLTPTATGITSAAGTLPPIVDTAVGAEGIVYGIGANLVGTCIPATNTCDVSMAQPLVPEGTLGSYKSVVIDNDGKLHVLYEREGTVPLEPEQFILVGTPPVIPEGAIIKFTPMTLNLGSRGNWVGVHIQLPGDLDENLIIPEQVQISQIAVEGFLPAAVEIYPAPGAPWSVRMNDAGVQVLKVKFMRYNKKGGPGMDDQSLIYWLREILKNQPVGTYPVTLTIKGQLTNNEWFQGTATFKANVLKKIH